MGEKPRDFVRDLCFDLSKNLRVFENDKSPASVRSTLSGPYIYIYIYIIELTKYIISSENLILDRLFWNDEFK